MGADAPSPRTGQPLSIRDQGTVRQCFGEIDIPATRDALRRRGITVPANATDAVVVDLGTQYHCRFVQYFLYGKPAQHDKEEEAPPADEEQ